jgi:uncharacterized protein (DUF1501 family)
MIVVILRGAMDSLAAVAPYGDPSYGKARGGLDLRRPGEPDGALDLDGFFGLHPSLAPILPMWRRGEFMIAHAVGIPYRARSHFDGQNILENGTETAHSTPDGWLNRAIMALGGADRRLGLAVGPGIPLMLRGAAPVVTFAPKGLADAREEFLSRVRKLYLTDEVLHKALEEAVQSQEFADRVLGGNRARRQGNQVRQSFVAAGKLLADRDGPRIGVIETEGWDTHAGQGIEGGRLANLLDGLAKGFAALPGAMGRAWEQTAVIAVTEFGRTAAMNGTGGTDHGTGTLAFIFGGAVRGGRVWTDWPGLSEGQLYEGRDLMPVTDLRSIFKGLMRDHLGIDERDLEGSIFPASASVKPAEGLIHT